MTEIWFAALFWVFSHLGISSTPLRGTIVGLVGERGYLGIYSLIAAAALANLIWVYSDVPRFDYIWLPNPDLYWVAKVTMPIALFLAVGGFMVRNPTNVGMSIDDPAQAADMATGVTRITRHPFQWGVILWATGHIVANGDWVSVIFFSSFLLLSLLGSFLMDHKKAQTMGEGWAQYAAVTSNVPFAAIVTGRNTLKINELWLPAVVGLVAYGALYYFHETLFGVVVI